MFLELILAIFLGLLFGTLTGLTPGIHINLIGTFLATLSLGILSSIEPIILITFIVAVAITHTFLDFIPSIILGCPDSDTELSILPGHKFMQEGRAHEAILLTTYGSISAIGILIILFLPLALLKDFIQLNYFIIEFAIPGILILSSMFLISLEKRPFSAFKIFILTGILGYLVLNSKTTEPLLPLLSGLFGASTLILSIKSKFQIPKQFLTFPKIQLKKPLLGAVLASPLCAFLPGLGSGQAAIIGSSISRTKHEDFLILLGATNTLVMGFSFIALYLISKTRTGAAATINKIFGTLNLETLFLIMLIVLISGLASFFWTKKLAKIFVIKIQKINYTKTSISTLLVLVLIVFLISNLQGIIILIVSTLLGIYCINQKIRRTHMMGCLVIPSIIWYLF